MTKILRLRWGQDLSNEDRTYSGFSYFMDGSRRTYKIGDMEIDILGQMVNSGMLEPNHMLIVDGPLQFIRQDTGKPEFADMFYNVVGVSKSFDPMLPTSSKSKRGGTQIGAELLKLEYGQRTPVFLKENSKHRKYGCWYLRIRPKNRVEGPLEGIIKVEKFSTNIRMRWQSHQ